jgi:hypothetical protein
LRIAYVTAGTIGLGHIVPAEAVRRGLLRSGNKAEFRVFGPPSDFASARLPHFTPIEIDAEEVTDPFRAPESPLAHALNEYRPDLLLAETFWAPLLYLLPIADCPAWLLLRKVPPVWLTGTDEVPFRSEIWDRIISIEPCFEDPVFTDYVDPLVVCNRDELRPSGSLRTRWAVDDGKTLVVVAQAGEPGEVDRIAVEAGPAHVVRVDGRSAAHPFPLAEWLGDADRIYSGAGYSAYWESKWLGWFDRTVFTPFPRPIDDQEWRLRECATYTPRENGADQLARWIGEIA